MNEIKSRSSRAVDYRIRVSPSRSSLVLMNELVPSVHVHYLFLEDVIGKTGILVRLQERVMSVNRDDCLNHFHRYETAAPVLGRDKSGCCMIAAGHCTSVSGWLCDDHYSFSILQYMRGSKSINIPNYTKLLRIQTRPLKWHSHSVPLRFPGRLLSYSKNLFGNQQVRTRQIHKKTFLIEVQFISRYTD